MHPGAAFVNAKVAGYVLAIELKPRINKEARKAGTNQRDKQDDRNQSFEHWCKCNGYNKRSFQLLFF